MIPTPDLSHLTKEDYLRVYEPAEDTFCLLDALEQDADLLRHAQPRLIVEIGSGTGCVSAFLSKIVGSSEASFVCTDINEFALSATRKTGTANGVRLETVCGHLLNALQSRCSGKIDLLVFNPPYVPTTEEEEQAAQQRGSIEGSWAGGSYGTNLLDDLITTLPLLLATDGSVYVVAIQQNNPPNIVRRLQEAGLTASICFSRRAGREHLHIIRATKSSSSTQT
ncbi:hypothetical protein CBS101457_006178 [Exobasidium rhododendri]|nr:hypothetical protein CBS101457_006178 [Exobasidium rhododendri]